MGSACKKDQSMRDMYDAQNCMEQHHCFALCSLCCSRIPTLSTDRPHIYSLQTAFSPLFFLSDIIGRRERVWHLSYTRFRVSAQAFLDA